MKIYQSNKLSCFTYPVYRNINTDSLATIQQMFYYIHSEADRLNKRIIVLYVTGSSGMFLAANIQELFRNKFISIKIIYVNKEKEIRHTNDVMVERVEKRKSLTVFIDDFISTGNTLLSVFKQANIIIDGICVSGNVYRDTTIDLISQKQKNGLKFIICRKYYK